VITGVSAGIGRASALLFAEEGATVVGADIDEVQGAEVEASIRESGGVGHFVKADVSNQEEVAKVLSVSI
jgi:NAD(P)-dependent dehydrogenase (short-subunit alcohol dehydrogenase family)